MSWWNPRPHLPCFTNITPSNQSTDRPVLVRMTSPQWKPLQTHWDCPLIKIRVDCFQRSGRPSSKIESTVITSGFRELKCFNSIISLLKPYYSHRLAITEKPLSEKNRKADLIRGPISLCQILASPLQFLACAIDCWSDGGRQLLHCRW